MKSMKHHQEDNSKQWKEELLASMHKQRQEAIDEITSLATSVDSARLFVAVVANMVFLPSNVDPEKAFGAVTARIEVLAYHLYPYFSTKGVDSITPFHTNMCMESLDKLFVTEGWAALETRADGEADEWERIGRYAKVEARFVRGSAYPEQTISEINEIQGRYENYFTARGEIGPLRSTKLIMDIVKTEEDKRNRHQDEIASTGEQLQSDFELAKKGLHEDSDLLNKTFKDKKTARLYGMLQGLINASWEVPVSIHDLEDMGTEVTLEEWESLGKLIGMTGEYRERMTDPINVRERPLFVLPDGRFLLVDLSNALDVLWERYEELLKEDADVFQEYQSGKAKWLEDRVHANLVRLFPEESVYRNACYPDPTKNEGSTTEIDAVVSWGPFLLLMEAKAKQFRWRGCA